MLLLACLPLAAAQPELPGTTIVRDLVFAKIAGKDMALDLYRPSAIQAPLPVVLWIYGGAWRQRNKDRQAGQATWLATKGYAVAVIDYPLSSEARFPTQTHATKAAVRWLRTNADQYKLDAGHIGAWGESSGGHLAAMLAVSGSVADLEGDLGNPKESSRIQAVVDFFGPTDFVRMDRAALPGGMKHDAADSPESLLIGGPIQDNKELAARANPVNYVSADDPPILILHGDRDPLVPVNQSELLFDACKETGVKATFFKIVGAGHGGPQFNTPVVRAMVLAFFDQYLKPAAH